MTRISDAMRAAADRAPVADMHIATATATARVRRRRAVRGSANGLVGAGAVAILVAGVVGSGGLPKNGRETANGTPAVGAPGPAIGTDNAGGGFAAPDLARACGYTLTTSPSGADIGIIAAPTATTIDPGTPLAVSVTATAGTAGTFTVGQPMAYVLWNGMVVAQAPADAIATSWSAAAGDTLVTDAKLALTNCWDGAALPSGAYTVVVSQGFGSGATPSPLPATTIVPDVPPATPTLAPDTSVGSDGSTVKPGSGGGAAGSSDGTVTSGGTVSPGGTGSSGTASSGTAVAPPADVSFTTAFAKPFDLTISGDAAKDPFGAYLGAVTQPTLPDGVVTPAEARAAYQAGETSLRWDMRAGTQRVVMTSSGPTASANEWQNTYYGCPTEGTPGTFPGRSADLGWLDVSASLPSSVHVSYGWVVDGNPLVKLSVKNTSPWTLPGFYGQPNAVMFLVRDGRVVAEAYPVSPDRNGGGVAVMGKAEAGASSALTFAPGGDGYLAAGASLSGSYLWRDVNGCWNANAPSDVTPGTYTVLTMQDVFVGVGGIYTMGGATGTVDGGPALGAPTMPGSAPGSGGASATGAVQPSPVVGPQPAQTPGEIAVPAPNQQDFASFQVWTSLGTVTVTG